MNDDSRTERMYWLVFSVVFGASLSVLGLVQLLSAALFCLAAVVFLTIHTYYNGQIGKNVQGRLATATPGVGLLATVMGAAAILLRGGSIAYWAAPGLSILGFAIMFGFLNKYGKFHRTETQ